MCSVTESLFRSLYSPHAEIMDAGRQGLMVLLKVQQRIPSHLITTGLKPLLGQLSDTNKLSVDFLKGLAVLLEPLQNFFKLEVGQKLLEHFRVIADPQTLQSIAGTVVVENENIKKLVGLANVFHLLPSNANIYLEDLANMIMNTEAHFDSFSPSPFTLPLSRFLCRYPEEGVAYFLRNLQFARHLRTLRNVLQARSAERFRRELATRANSIISDFLSSAETVRVVAGLALCVDLADVDPRWLIDHPEVVNALLAIWRNERLQPSPNTSESRQKCLLISQLLRKALEETPRVDLLFDLIAIFSRDLPIDTVQTARFFYEHVALQGSLPYRRNVLSRFVTWIEGRVSWTDKLYFIRIVLTPMLQAHVTRSAKEGLLDSDIISCLFRCFWQPDTEEKKQELLTAGNLFLIELLHLTSVIVTHYSYLLEQNKKELIQFAWSHVNSPEIIVKQSAHVLAARLWNTFEAPDKFIRATLSGLLKQTDADAKKSLTEQGLDVIVKVFPRMTSEDPDDPAWAQAMRRLLSEETIGAPQTTAIYSFMVRHPDTFYPVRSLFVPHMVHSVNRLGFFGNQNPDARVLTLDLIEVLFNWEKQAAAAAESNNSMDVDDGNTSDQGPWTMSLAARENVVSYLVRLAVTLIGDPSPTPRSQFATKALSLVKQILGASGWKDVTVKLNYYLRPLEVVLSAIWSLRLTLLTVPVDRLHGCKLSASSVGSGSCATGRLCRQG
jgi:transformation/transcription domain-associated protein